MIREHLIANQVVRPARHTLDILIKQLPRADLFKEVRMRIEVSATLT